MSNRSLVERIADAVLYEGYILYPYRATAVKNRQRFHFGVLYPESFSIKQTGTESFLMQTECLIQGDPSTRVEMKIRFLHLVAREVYEGVPTDRKIVGSLQIGDQVYRTWQEAVEREFLAPGFRVSDVLGEKIRWSFSFPDAVEEQPLTDSDGKVAGAFLRRQDSIHAAVDVSAEEIRERIYRVTIRISNRSEFPDNGGQSRDHALLRSLVSTHSILTVQGGEFLSLLDPPAFVAEDAAACRNTGSFPVLVGQQGQRDTLLASPIILYDYPEIAPESPNNLYDSTEIDEILTLRILTLTEEEKKEMRQLDDRSRQLLERTETLPMEHLQKMHGAWRGLQHAKTDVPEKSPFDFWEARPGRESVAVLGVEVHKGDRVRLWPVKTADIMDMALKGRSAIVDAIEEDYEGKVYLAVIVEEDPGRDLGEMRQPGHRFFFTPEEVEPLGSDQRSER